MSWFQDNLGVSIFLISFAGLLLLSQLLVVFRFSKGPKFFGSHVVISGGSQGLGKEIAKELVLQGANVSIIARGQQELSNAISYISSSNSPKHGDIKAFSADVTDTISLSKALNEAVEEFGPIDILIPCAGSSLTGKVLDRSLKDYQDSMNLNYMGTVNLVILSLPSMIKRRYGSICFISSALALTSYIGYATYAPTKYAIRGFADTLRNEMLPYNISIHIAYPVNINTPGYQHEQETKPLECKTIEQYDTLYEPHVIAKKLLKSLRKGDYNIYCGDFAATILGTVAEGMSPRVNAIADVLFFPFILLIAKVIRFSWDREVQKEKYFQTNRNII